MNNKRLGTEFEREAVKRLSEQGYWVHFITPASNGSQPFDIIASKDDKPFVADCKTTVTPHFNITRLEENQVMAFDLWLAKGNNGAFVLIKYADSIYKIPYRMLKGLKKINLEEYGEFKT